MKEILINSAQKVLCPKNNTLYCVSFCTGINKKNVCCDHYSFIHWVENEGICVQCKYEPLLSAKYIDAIDRYTSENFDEHCEEGLRVIAANNINGFINEIISIYVESNREAQKQSKASSGTYKYPEDDQGNVLYD